MVSILPPLTVSASAGPFSYPYAELIEATTNELASLPGFLNALEPAPVYFSEGRQIFFNGLTPAKPPFSHIMKGLQRGAFQVYRMNDLREAYWVCDVAWLSQANGDLHALLAREEDRGGLSPIRGVRHNIPANGAAAHVSFPVVTPMNQALHGFDVGAWIQQRHRRWGRPVAAADLKNFEEFLRRLPDLAKRVEKSRSLVEAGDLKYLEKILSSLKGKWADGYFIIPKPQRKSLESMVAGRLAEWPLRGLVLADYHRLLRERDSQAILLFKPEICSTDQRPLADALIARVDGEEKTIHLYRDYELALSKKLAAAGKKKALQRLENLAQGKIAVKTDEGRWELFEVKLAEDFEAMALSLPERQQNGVRSSAKEIVTQAIHTFSEKKGGNGRTITAPPAPPVLAAHVDDYFRRKNWETPEVAWASGDAARVLVAMVRWAVYQRWGGRPPMGHDGQDLRGISELGISDHHAIRKLFLDGDRSVNDRHWGHISLTQYQKDLQRLLTLGGLNVDAAARLVQAAYFSLWDWESLAVAEASKDLRRILIALLRQAAFGLWGGIAPQTKEGKLLNGVTRDGIGPNHPMRRFLQKGLNGLVVNSTGKIPLKQFQQELADLLAFGGMEESAARDFVHDFYFAHWGWELLGAAEESQDPLRILIAALREAAYSLWGGNPPTGAEGESLTGISENGIVASHPIRKLLAEGPSYFRTDSSSRLPLIKYQSDLVLLLVLSGHGESEAWQLVRQAYAARG